MIKNTDERFCVNCEKYTLHKVRDSQHERDSSSDWQQCLECNLEYFGLTGQYNDFS